MTNRARTLTANTTFYTAALTLQKLLSFLYFTYLARSIGAELTGKYFFALSIGAIAMAFIDLGLVPVLTRQSARDRDSAQSWVNTIVMLKLMLSLVVVGVMLLLYAGFMQDPVTGYLIMVALGIAIMDSFAMTFFAVVRSFQNLTYESISSILFQFIVLILGSLAIYQGSDIRVIMLALAIASLTNLLFGYATLRRFGVRPRPVWDMKLIQHIMLLAAPFAIAAGFIKVNAYSDTVLLRMFMGDEAVGTYSVAYKITFAFQFIPMAFVAALYPAFSSYWKYDRSNLRDSFAKAMKYLLIVSLPLVAGLWGVAYELIPLVYTSEYTNAVLPLLILISSLPLLFVNFPIGSLLNACDRQTRQTVHLGIAMVLSVGLNLVLIPLWGPVGAALASSLSTLATFGLGIWVAKQITGLTMVEFFRLIVPLVIIGLIQYLVLVVVKPYLGWLGAGVVSGVVYLVALYGTGSVRMAEVKQQLASLRK